MYFRADFPLKKDLIPYSLSARMTLPHLILELLFDLLALGLGVACIRRAGDNYPKLWWGIISVLVGVAFTYENVKWLCIVSREPDYRFTALLDIGEMAEYYAVATIVGFFPCASLSPGYLNVKRVLPFLVPPLVVITAGLSYLVFNGTLTPLASLGDVAAQAGQTDVKVRLTLFAFSLLTPIACFFFPLLRGRSPRRPTREMWVFLTALIGLLVIYVCFTLAINYFVFNLFGAACVAFAIVFSVAYLRRESPFSRREEMSPALPLPLFGQIDSYVRSTGCFASASFSLPDLSHGIGETEYAVSEAIKSGGFSGFHEWVTDFRLEHFRLLAAREPDMNVKELMYRCGFTSRSAFYRVFAKRYGITPSAFVKEVRSADTPEAGASAERAGNGGVGA